MWQASNGENVSAKTETGQKLSPQSTEGGKSSEYVETMVIT